jgi:hypothetical protein
MKRSVSFLLLGLSIFLSGCAQTSVPANTETEENISLPVVTQETLSTEATSSQEQLPVQKDDVNFTGLVQVIHPAFITPEIESTIMTGYVEYFSPDANNKNTWESVSANLKFFEFGTITDGKYKDSILYLLKAECDGMCMGPLIYRLAYNEKTDKLVMLGKYSATYEDAYDFFKPLLGNIDKTTSIKALDLPETIQIPNSSEKITLNAVDDYFFADAKEMTNFNLTKVAFKDAVVGDVYFTPEGFPTGCLYVKKLDGTIASYAYDPKLLDAKNPVSISWKDGSGSENIGDSYAFVIQGCGISGLCYYIADVNGNDLTLQGTTSNGVDLYSVSKPLSKEQQKDVASVNNAQTVLSEMYDQYSAVTAYDETATAVPFDKFATSHPLLYFNDPFGRFVGIIKNDFKPAAECGKPVIYLYPQQEMNVSVQVGIDRFTETIPNYGTNGWNVRATPESKIFNYADGQTYPYLFWEGQSDKSISVDKGFIVACEEVSSFLEDSLTKMGLNNQERADFEEFWVTRMLDNNEPYFFISFVGTRDFNKVAPLTIEPKPDTLIRVFMYYSPMNEKINVMPQTLSSIPRNGFTVVEWGGTSSVPWRK